METSVPIDIRELPERSKVDVTSWKMGTMSKGFIAGVAAAPGLGQKNKVNRAIRATFEPMHSGQRDFRHVLPTPAVDAANFAHQVSSAFPYIFNQEKTSPFSEGYAKVLGIKANHAFPCGFRTGTCTPSSMKGNSRLRFVEMR